MSNRVFRGVLLGILVCSFVILENARAEEVHRREGSVASSRQGIIDPVFSPSRNTAPVKRRAIIDPLFQPNPVGRNVPRRDNSIIDPVFNPNQNATAVNRNAIIDPLFQPNPATAENESGIIDPLFKSGDRSRRKTD